MLPDLTSQKVAIPAALFLALSPGVLLTTDGKKIAFRNGKTNQMAVLFHALVFFLVYSLIAKAMGLALLGSQPRSPPHPPTRVWWCRPLWSDQPPSRSYPRGGVRPRVRDFASSISSILLNKRMKYLVLAPASMGIYSLIGALKARESSLVDVKEISGSSAGSIITLFLAVGMSVDEILKISLSLDVSQLMKIRITSFYSKFGFVDISPIRKKLVEICGHDPTFNELDMKIYISAFCLNTSETVYFSKDTHPDMKVIDAVCMSMAVPVIFACGTYGGNTYIDGGTMEQYPLAPFLDKKPHEITCIKIKLNKIFKENISNPKEFIEALILSTLSNRTEYDKSIEVVEVNVGDTDIFNFSMTYEEKIRLFNMGYLK